MAPGIGSSDRRSCQRLRPRLNARSPVCAAPLQQQRQSGLSAAFLDLLVDGTDHPFSPPPLLSRVLRPSCHAACTHGACTLQYSLSRGSWVARVSTAFKPQPLPRQHPHVHVPRAIAAFQGVAFAAAFLAFRA